MKGRMKNAIAEVSGRIPDGYQLTSQEILELIGIATISARRPWTSLRAWESRRLVATSVSGNGAASTNTSPSTAWSLPQPSTISACFSTKRKPSNTDVHKKGGLLLTTGKPSFIMYTMIERGAYYDRVYFLSKRRRHGPALGA